MSTETLGLAWGIAFLFLLYTLIVYVVRLGCRVCQRNKKCPVSVNYHFSRQCNKTCGFCFHTAKTSHRESEENAMFALKRLADAGMRKLNFAGGEPFLHPKFLGNLVSYAKDELELESVSIVTNGSLVNEKWLAKYGECVDILAVSCDSFDEKTNIKIGRGSGNSVEQLHRIAGWCRKYGIKFKLNTVVCKLNVNEDMNRHIADLKPFRWKCFQVLMVAGENDSAEMLRDAREFQISDEEFEDFCERHKNQSSLVRESNRLMAKSYLILDEYLRFLDRDGKIPSDSILHSSVGKALSQVSWDQQSFVERGGIYEWTRDKAEAQSCGTTAVDW